MITLVLPYPVSANAYWRSIVMPGQKRATVLVSKEGKEYKEFVGWYARSRGITEPLQGRVQITVVLYPHRPKDWEKRQREHGASWDDTVQCIDLDNANKVLLDAIKGVVIDDDKWVRKITSHRAEPDKHGARVVVCISPMPAATPQSALTLEAA